MVPVSLKSLMGRLNDTCRRGLEGALGLCMSRTNYNAEIEHWLMKLLEAPNTDLGIILRQYGVDSSRLLRDVTKAIDRFKTGNSREESTPYCRRMMPRSVFGASSSFISQCSISAL